MNLIEIYITEKQWKKSKLIENSKRLKFAQDDEDLSFKQIGDFVSIDFGFGNIQVCKENFDKVLNKYLNDFD